MPCWMAVITLCFRAAHWSLFGTSNVILRIVTLVPLITVIAARQHALGTLGHDGAHRLICRNRVLNDLLANILCTWPLMSNLSGYRAFHFEHYRKVGTPDDPELIHKNNEWRILNVPVLGQWPVPIRPWKFALSIAATFFAPLFLISSWRRVLPPGLGRTWSANPFSLDLLLRLAFG